MCKGSCREATEGLYIACIYNPSVSLRLPPPPYTGEAFLVVLSPFLTIEDAGPYSFCVQTYPEDVGVSFFYAKIPKAFPNGWLP